MNNILEKIIKKKVEKLEETKKNISLGFLKDKIANTEDSFLGEPLELDSTYNDSLKSDTIIVIRK